MSDHDGPKCALRGCGKPLQRRIKADGGLESLTDFVRRSYCSPECSMRGRRLHMRRLFVRSNP
jgi:hypothetical protein